MREIYFHSASSYIGECREALGQSLTKWLDIPCARFSSAIWMVFDRAMQLRCSLEERSSDLARMDDAEIGFILDSSGGLSH